MDAEQKLVKLIEDLATNSFKDHIIKEELNQGVFRSFLCRRELSNIYMFRVTTIPGRLIVTGDIGTLVVERMYDMFEWAPSAINDLNYFAEKVPHEIVTREFCQDVAHEWIDEQKEEEEADIAELELLLASLEDFTGPDVFNLAVYESGVCDGCDMPDFRNWKPSFLWCREAVKWFFNNATSEQLKASE